MLLHFLFRYNKVHHNGVTIPSTGIGISWGGGTEAKSDFYAYGNFVYSNSQTGIRSHDNGDYAYWWSNLVVNNPYNGYQALNRAGSSPDNVQIFNNTFYHNGEDTSDYTRSGMYLGGGTNHDVKNNIFQFNSSFFFNSSATCEILYF